VIPKSSASTPVKPIGRLDDGTAYFAPLGELVVIADGERVLCHLCGRALQMLSAEHLRRHGWTPQLYRQAFGLNRSTALCSPAVVERRRAIGSERYLRNAKVREGLAQGQELARSGRLLEMSHAVQQRGTASLQRRSRSAAVTAPSRVTRRVRAVERRNRLIAELGFTSERDYLIDRYLDQGWPVSRIKAELEIGSAVLTEILDGAGIKRRRPGGTGPALARWGRVAASESTGR
jgi:ROS/MUCR transcriptional regulator protein